MSMANYTFSDVHYLDRCTTRCSAIAERPRWRCIRFGQKWKTGTGWQYYTDIIGLSSTTVTYWACKAIEFGEKMQTKGYYTIQGHWGRYQWKARMRLPISD